MAADEGVRPSSATPSTERARSFFGRNSTSNEVAPDVEETETEEKGRPTKWSMGVLNDPKTHEVPGNLYLL